jgi:hypothetical protein
MKRRIPATWKAVELRIARYIGTRRTPLSGGNDGRTRSDTLHPRLFAEIKHGSAVPRSYKGIVKLFEQVEKLAERENKHPVLILHEKGRWGGVSDYPAYVRLQRDGPVIMVPLSFVAGEWGE